MTEGDRVKHFEKHGKIHRLKAPTKSYELKGGGVCHLKRLVIKMR